MDIISVTIVALGTIFFGLVSARLRQSVVTAPMVFVLFGQSFVSRTHDTRPSTALFWCSRVSRRQRFHCGLLCRTDHRKRLASTLRRSSRIRRDRRAVTDVAGISSFWCRPAAAGLCQHHIPWVFLQYYGIDCAKDAACGSEPCGNTAATGYTFVCRLVRTTRSCIDCICFGADGRNCYPCSAGGLRSSHGDGGFKCVQSRINCLSCSEMVCSSHNGHEEIGCSR